jgi:predicted HicB family RNase H-like nuclease
MRKIFGGTAYDTDTGELIVEVGTIEDYELARLYRTRNGHFFIWWRYLTPNYENVFDLRPLDDDKARKWMEDNANHLVEKYFGEMQEGGAAERRFTLRLPNNLAKRLDRLAEGQKLSLTRYITRCLERCASTDGQPVNVVRLTKLGAISNQNKHYEPGEREEVD